MGPDHRRRDRRAGERPAAGQQQRARAFGAPDHGALAAAALRAQRPALGAAARVRAARGARAGRAGAPVVGDPPARPRRHRTRVRDRDARLGWRSDSRSTARWRACTRATRRASRRPSRQPPASASPGRCATGSGSAWERLRPPSRSRSTAAGCSAVPATIGACSRRRDPRRGGCRAPRLTAAGADPRLRPRGRGARPPAGRRPQPDRQPRVRQRPHRGDGDHGGQHDQRLPRAPHAPAPVTNSPPPIPARSAR